MQLYPQLIRDLEVTSIFDLTPGTGAFAVAALYQEVRYSGICHNEHHHTWLSMHVERMFVGIAMDKKLKTGTTK